MPSDPFYDFCRKIAENKILCKCGNADWEQFIYMGGANANIEGGEVTENNFTVIAGCKLCMACQHFTGGKWERGNGETVQTRIQ